MSNSNLYKRMVKVVTVTSAATANAQVLVPGPCKVLSLHMTVNTGALRTVHLFNKSLVPNPATDTALCLLNVYSPATSMRDIVWSDGLPFDTGLSITITNGILPNTSNTVAANDVLLTITYAEV